MQQGLTQTQLDTVSELHTELSGLLHRHRLRTCGHTPQVCRGENMIEEKKKLLLLIRQQRSSCPCSSTQLNSFWSVDLKPGGLEQGLRGAESKTRL